MEVIILAAGQGKRMRSDLPKVLQPLAAKPLLAYVLGTARALSAKRICVVYGHGGERVQAAFANDSDIQWVRQEPQRGTAHAVQQALPLLDQGETALVLYGDVPLIRAETLERLIEAAQGGYLALLTAELDDPTGYGRIVRDAGGTVRRIVEDSDATPEERHVHEINTGFIAAPVEHLRRWLPRIGNDNAKREYYLTDVVGFAVSDGVQVKTVRPRAAWETVGVNSKIQLAELERILQRETAQSLMEQGVTLTDPTRIDIRGELVCGRDVEIDVNCVFEGRVELCDGVRVGANCVLRNVTIGAGTRLAPFSLLEDSEVGPECRIGPYARLRPGNVLGEDVHIGNFVELKNSQIADHSKANHLSYIGDATVGRNVNVGCGTITCNYDGAVKHRTVVEDDVFIGSDTQLVAPVTVGRGATLGAGTTLTQNAPAEQLTISRVRQVSIRGWKRPVKQKKE